MADKEATVYIVDCGRSMGKKNHGRDISDFDWAMRYVWDRITSTVATGRKTATLGVVGLKTDGTDNELGSEESFENISVLQPISQILMPELRALKDKLHVSKTDDGDAISALVIAIQMISTYCKKLKYRRKIVLITNGLGDMDAEDTAQITDKIKADDMELVILGVDFDDYDFGFKEEDKSKEKTSNERLLRTLADECDGVVGTLEQAVSELAMPRVKTVRPVPSFRGQLMLGDPSKYDSAMVINVERYPRTVIARPATSSQFVLKTDMAGQSSGQSSNTMEVDPEARDSSSNQNALSGVKNTRSYQVPDESAPGGKRDVERDELAKGYEYGRTAVAISESEENITKLETQAGLEIIGFVPKDKYERYMNLSQACVVIPAKANDKASMALSSLIHALWELESYAVARLVVKTDKSPVIVLLAPSIEPEYECLIDIQLPFAEDVRQYKFPPLDKVVTVSGKVLTEHRNLPNDALKAAMDSYVDSMDISSLGTDDEGNSTEYMPMDDTFSPVLHRIDQAVRWRAVRPLDPLPPVPEALTKYSNPPEELVAKTKSQLDKLIAAAEVKKVPPKQKGRKRFRDTQKPLSGLDVDSLLNRDRKRTKISSENAVPEFRQMLETTEDLGAIQDAANQLSQIIRDYIKHSLGDSGYGRAVEALRVMREELTELEEPAIYNSAIKDLKSKLQAEELGGDRKEMWWEIRKNRLGLITSKLSELSEVTEEEAQEFLA